jgi:16S rRNA G966 N2-methylase RsmD
LNKHILDHSVQEYIYSNLNADVHKIAMAKSPFPDVTGTALAGQIAAKKKCIKKLPTWFITAGIYYPPLLSVEQCSSEITAAYKAKLAPGESLIDLTGGYGVDSYYFASRNMTVVHCEIDMELSAIAAYNSIPLQQSNTRFICTDGITFLQQNADHFDNIYIDPARRGSSGKVFMLKDCTPNVVGNLELLLSRSSQVIIKTAPLLDITAGLKELKNVAEIHIVSVRNECKELIWILRKGYSGPVKIVCAVLNTTEKEFSFFRDEEPATVTFSAPLPGHYLYEPDAALLKSGAFSLIAFTYKLQKLHPQTQLYSSAELKPEFPGRIFSIDQVLSAGDIKKEKNLAGNVIVRNYPAEAASLVKKYQIKPDDNQFVIFSQSAGNKKIVIKANIIQHY